MFNSEESAIQNCIEAVNTNDSSPIILINKSITQFPSSYALQFLLGSELAEQNNFVEAKSAFLSALKFNNEFGIARIQLAMLYITNGEFDPINELLEPLYSSSDQDAYHFFAKAIMCVCSDDIENATNFVNSGVTINKSNPALSDNMLRMLSIISDNDETSTPNLKKVTSVSGENESIQSALLDIYNKQAN